ncbi:MAG: hypothetical protein K9N07_04680 [Candidatus Cloacimonetes bacterium]|nr:hypothetical protein [Candidatus Cloacimonadota bacterium]
MKKNRIPLIVLGVITILSQTILLREMLVEVNGNEIIFSIYLSLWLFFIASGSYLSGFVKTTKNKTIIGFSALLVVLPLQFYLVRSLSSLFTFVSNQILDLPSVFLLGFIILLPGCLLSGWLFPQLCNQLNAREGSLRQGYFLECIGIVLGSIVFAVAMLIISQIILLCFLSAVGFLILYYVYRKKILLIPFIIFLFIIPFSTSFYQKSYSKKYQPQKLIAFRDSHLGRFDLTEMSGQKNYYWNGELFASSGNEMYSQQMVNFVMLQHPEPRELLIVGGLLNGFMQEILQNEYVYNIDYLEMDKNILDQAQKFKKVEFIHADPVWFLQNTEKKYDLILLDLPDPSSLLLNRFYTRDFFNILKENLKDTLSIVAITLSNGKNFMTQEIKDLNATILHTFSAEFPNVILIPATKNIFIGSKGNFISNQYEILQKRNKTESAWFNKTVIYEKCNSLRIEQILKSISSSSAEMNTIANPRAYLSTILLWTDLVDLRQQKTVDFLQSKSWLVMFIAFVIIFTIGLFASLISRSPERRLDLHIFSISLINFVIELVLIYLFQIRFGYVYFVIFLFTASFMIGLAAGFSNYNFLKKNSITKIWFINLSLVLLMIIIYNIRLPAVFYFILNIIFAFLEGTILTKLLDKKSNIMGKGSTFYFLDSFGAMTGGIIVSICIFPLFGLQSSLYFLSFILLVNLLLSLIPKY